MTITTTYTENRTVPTVPMPIGAGRDVGDARHSVSGVFAPADFTLR